MDDGDAAAAFDESEWAEPPETQGSCSVDGVLAEGAWQSYEVDGVEPQAAAVNTQHIGYPLVHQKPIQISFCSYPEIFKVTFVIPTTAFYIKSDGGMLGDRDSYF